MFTYRRKTRADIPPVETLVGYHRPDYDSILPGSVRSKPAVSVFPPLLSEIDDGSSASSPLGNTTTRAVMSSPTHTYSGTRFHFNEELTFFTGATPGSSSSGTEHTLFKGYVVADNTDLTVPDGTLVFRHLGRKAFTSLSNMRVVGTTSGANVHFTTVREKPRMTQAWTANTTADALVNMSVQFAQFGPFLFIAEDTGIHPIRFWGGGAATAKFLHQAPFGHRIAVFQNRLWVIRGDRLFGSYIGDPFGWDFTRSGPNDPMEIAIGSDDQDDGTALTETPQGDLVVFKKNSTHRLTGFVRNPPSGATRNEFSRVVVSDNIGCAAPNTVVQTDKDVFWMSLRGVHSLQATDEYGDVVPNDLSFPIADFWNTADESSLRRAQAVYHPRLGLYILGFPSGNSRFLNKLLVYDLKSRQWKVWDIGDFTSIAIGPSQGGEARPIHVALVRDSSVFAEQTVMAILDFEGSEDFDSTIEGPYENIAIETIIEPGDIFSAQVAPEIRHAEKTGANLHFTMAPHGRFTSDIIYSWDGGPEKTEKLKHNAVDKDVFGAGAKFGTILTSRDDTRYASVRFVGGGRSPRIRIVDSNVGRLPHLHMDVELDLGDIRQTPYPLKG